MEEIWKDVIGFEGLYMVSNTGKIMALKRKVAAPNGFRTARQRIIAQADCNGYKLVMLCKEGARKNVHVHRIIAEAFIPNPENKATVNHKNGNKSDHSIENLEWCSYSENLTHAIKTGLKPSPVGEKSHQSKLTDSEAIEILQIHKMYGLNYSRAAKEYNVNIDSIRGTCIGKYRKHLHFFI